MRHSPPLPPWLADMPRLDEFPNLVAPADTDWKSGKPLKGADIRRSEALGMRRCCEVCGYPIPGRVYTVVAEGGSTDSHFLYPGGLYAQLVGPVHRSCAFYAVIACPYLKYRTARRKLSDHAARGAAMIVGFNNYGRFQPPGHTDVCFGYFGIAEEIPFNTYNDIAANYDDAVAADANLRFTTAPRLYWTDSPADQQRLDATLAADTAETTARLHEAVTTVGGHPYRLHLI
ncbi:hypothetical protein MYSE111917_16600 [Mycobacterium senriense]|uniref:Uncharacterized protein n=1 Tax=Mycobacterium senriense TaxID=2775496 RepID=A0ABM7SU07_9MYCO|nr:hypothetical protein [Mycobacterium senriense]BCZ24857.1 hypothetical protein MTY59_47120 [Mycobacterium senriense]